MFLVSSNPTLADETLSISPVVQQTPVWCWAAVTEMVLDHFGVENASPVGNFQCAVVAAAGAVSNRPDCYYDCGRCVVPAGTASNLIFWMESYSEVASQALGRQVADVNATYRSGALRKNAVVNEIDDGNPVIAGISPGQRISMRGGSQHVALIVGYEDDGNVLIVNDPFPFADAGWTDPYAAAGAELIERGQYRISYGDFVQGLGWRESIRVEQSP